MEHDVFEHDDRVVNDRANSGGQTAERHEIEPLSGELQNDEGDEKRGRNHEASNKRGTPVAQEENKDDGRENEAKQYGVANARDGFMNEGGLIVEWLDMHAGWQSWPKLLDLGVNFVGDVERIAVRLPMNTQKNGGFAIGGDHGVDGCDGRRNFCNIAKTDGNTCRRRLHDDLADLFRRANLAADQAEHQLMIVLDETGRVDQIGLANGVENIVDGDTRREEARRFGRDMELWNAAPLNENRGHAIEAVDAWLEIVSGDFPKLALRKGVRSEAVAEDGKCSEGEAVCFDFGGRR